MTYKGQMINALSIHHKLTRPPIEWNDLATELTELNGTLAETVKELEAVAERAARLARYLDAHGQGHAVAVKAQNHVGRIVHEKAFGYNTTRDITF